MACHSPWQESGMEEHDTDKALGYTFGARDAQPTGWAAASRKGWEKGASAHPLLYVPPHIPPGPCPMQGCKRHPRKDLPVFGLVYSFLLKKRVTGRIFPTSVHFPLHSKPCPSIFSLQKGKEDPKPMKKVRF